MALIPDSAANDGAPGRANADDRGDPPKRRRGKSLNNLEAIEKEMGSIYWAMKHNEVAIDKGRALVSVLARISEVIRAGLAVDEELRELRRLVKAYERNPL